MAGPYERTKLGDIAQPKLFNELQAGIEEHETQKLSVADAAELVRDTIASALVAGANVTITPNDGADTITIAAGGTDAEVVRDTIGTALTAGTGITKTVDDAGNTITIAASSAVILTTGNQTLGGTKTFSSPVVVATPTGTTHATTKAYVDAIKAGAIGFVNHGATAGTARPSGYASILWLGTVEPTNMANGDIWLTP